MIDKLTSRFILFYFRKTDYEIEEKRISYFTKTILLVTISLFGILAIIGIVIHPNINASDYSLWLGIAIVAVIFLIFKRGYVNLAGILFVITFWLTDTALAFTFEGVRDVAIVAYILLILIAMLITKPWQALATGILSLISLWVIFYFEYKKIIIPKADTAFNYSIEFSVILFFVIVLINLNAKSYYDFYKRIQKELEDRKLAEKALIQAKNKAEESDRLKTAFMNNISHEVRTPLNGILGFSQLILQPDLSEEEKSFYLEVLNDSSDRLVNTITNYMDISLLTSGNLSANKQPVSIHKLLNEIYQKFYNKCKSKNLKLILQIPTESNDNFLQCDASYFEKSVSHLVDNAIKFTQTGSIELGYYLSNNFYEIFVKDTGFGINSEASGKIFDYFTQGEVSSSRGYEGSGLGLSIAKGLVELMGGKIKFESTEGKGSAFYIVFPAQEEIINPVFSNIKIPMPESKVLPVILLVDDDELSLDLYKAILKETSFKYLVTRNGLEAIEACRKYSEISLVLMDIKMPVMDGYTATQKIREFRKDLTIVAVTAYAMIGDKEKAINAGCTDCITKPISPVLLLSSINKYLVNRPIPSSIQS